jgi:hypothetical protein
VCLRRAAVGGSRPDVFALHNADRRASVVVVHAGECDDRVRRAGFRMASVEAVRTSASRRASAGSDRDNHRPRRHVRGMGRCARGAPALPVSHRVPLRRARRVARYVGRQRREQSAPPVRCHRRERRVRSPGGHGTATCRGRSDPRLRAALAVYREDLSAASPFYRFLAFWNVLETSFPNDEAKRDSFIRRVAPSSSYLSFPTLGDLAQHFRENSRNAIAHIVRSDPTDTSLDPDMPEDRERLDLEARWLQDVARKAVLQVWPDPVGLIRRG